MINMKGDFTFTLTEKELTEIVRKHIKETSERELPEVIAVEFVVKRVSHGFYENDSENVTARISFNVEL